MKVNIKLNIQLASSLNLIWRSIVSLAFLAGWLICIYKLYFIILKFMTNFTFCKTSTSPEMSRQWSKLEVVYIQILFKSKSNISGLIYT